MGYVSITTIPGWDASWGPSGGWLDLPPLWEIGKILYRRPDLFLLLFLSTLSRWCLLSKGLQDYRVKLLCRERHRKYRRNMVPLWPPSASCDEELLLLVTVALTKALQPWVFMRLRVGLCYQPLIKFPFQLLTRSTLSQPPLIYLAVGETKWWWDYMIVTEFLKNPSLQSVGESPWLWSCATVQLRPEDALLRETNQT